MINLKSKNFQIYSFKIQWEYKKKKNNSFSNFCDLSSKQRTHFSLENKFAKFASRETSPFPSRSRFIQKTREKFFVVSRLDGGESVPPENYAVSCFVISFFPPPSITLRLLPSRTFYADLIRSRHRVKYIVASVYSRYAPG